MLLKKATMGENHIREDERRMNLCARPNQNSVSKHESRLSLKESASEETRTVGERISMQEERSRDSLLMKLPKVTSVPMEKCLFTIHLPP
jgi:hypothetical protein